MVNAELIQASHGISTAPINDINETMPGLTGEVPGFRKSVFLSKARLYNIIYYYHVKYWLQID